MEHVALFVLGLALLAAGTPLLVFGSARLDRRIGRDPFAVGVAALAIGPCIAGLTFDLAVALRPPAPRDPGYALTGVVGRVAGSAVAGVGLVLGVAALVRPLAASARVFYTAIPMVLVAALLFWFVTIDKSVARGVGGGLVAAFATAMAVLFGLARREPEAVKEELAGWVPERFAVRWAVLLAFAGLAATLGGATLAADRLYPVGRAILNVAVLGETLVAFATALPAVGAAAVAARRGRANLALGVVVGFVLCNLLLALGAAALVQPLPLTRHAIAQEIPAVALFTALLLLVLVRLTVPRWAGGLLVAGYAGFVVWQLLRVPPR